jgi:hypothetical protein
MANADVLDILSDTITPVNRGSANKDEIIREKVLCFSLFLNQLNYLFLRKKVRKKVFVDRKV